MQKIFQDKKVENIYSMITSGVFYALIFSLPFERIPSIDLAIGSSSLTIRLSSVLAIVFIGLLVPLLWSRRKIALQMPYIGLLVFLFVYFLSMGLSIDFSRSAMVFGFTVLTMLTAVSVAQYVTPGRLHMMKQMLYWATWIVVIFGYYQYFGDLLGLSTAWTGLRADYTKVVFGFPRIQSTGLEPLYYANFLLIPFFIFAADFLKGNKERKFLLIAIATQVALSVSRGAYAGAILGLAILLVLGVKAKVKWQQFAGLGAMLILSVVLALFMTTLEFKNDKNTGTTGEKKTDAIVAQATNFDTQDDRDRNRSLAVQAFSSAPIFGIGPGGFDQYAREQAPIYVGTPGRIIVNNEPLELLAEGGILAFASLAVTMLWIVWQAVSAAWRGKGVPGAWPWLAGLICYLAALVVQYQTFSTLYIMHVWVVIGILIGVTKLSSGQSVAGKRRGSKKLARSSSRK